MFPKSSVFAVVAFVAFMALGALLFPQVAEAQECIWDCDLGSDPFNNPGENSPDFSIVYCFDQPCIVTLNTAFNIFTSIPTASVSQSVNPPGLICDGSTLNSITISGNVVAVAKKNGVPDPNSAAEALFNIVANKVICNPDLNNNLTATISVGDGPGTVIGGSINILNNPILNAGHSELTKPFGWPGCTNDKQTGDLGSCIYPLGNNQSNTLTQLLATWPLIPQLFQEKVLYSATALGRAASMRMCKGPANKSVSFVDCKVGQASAVGGFVADVMFNVDVGWAGAGDKFFNPVSNTGVTDVITPLFADIVIDTVTCSANGGTPKPAGSCSTMPSKNALRCDCPARDLLPSGCTNGEPVNLVVRGNVFSADANRDVKFIGEDNPVCKN